MTCVLPSMIPEDEVSNFETFKDCLSTSVISRLAPDSGKKRAIKGRKNEIKPVAKVAPSENGESDAAELAEFIEVGISTSSMSLRRLELIDAAVSC